MTTEGALNQLTQIRAVFGLRDKINTSVSNSCCTAHHVTMLYISLSLSFFIVSQFYFQFLSQLTVLLRVIFSHCKKCYILGVLSGQCFSDWIFCSRSILY